MVVASPPLPPRIILMDDDLRVLTAVGRLLASMGLDVTPVSSCTAARHAAAHVQADLLIADQVLPDGDGVACAAELKARYGFATLVYSADIRPPGPVEGIDDWVEKPGNGELENAIRALLTRRRVNTTHPATYLQRLPLRDLA